MEGQDLGDNQQQLIRVRCGSPFAERSIEGSLRMQGFEFSADAAMNLVVDKPRGYALDVVERVLTERPSYIPLSARI